MATHGSLSPREQKSFPINPNLKRRARLLAVYSRVDPRTRALLRYGLEIHDPYLEQVVMRIEGGEMYIEHIHLNDD